MNRRTFIKTVGAVTPAILAPEAFALGGVCIGLVVLIGGGIAIYLLIKKCKNAKPKELPPEDDNVIVPTAYQGANFVIESPACTNTSLVQESGSMLAFLAEGDGINVTVNPETLTSAESSEFARSHGLNPDADSYSFLGKPIDQSQSPISKVPGVGPIHVAVAGENQITVAVQSSADLVNWTTHFKTTIPQGTAIKFYDVTDGPSKFYRAIPA